MPTRAPESAMRLSPYLPRPVMDWLADEPDSCAKVVDGTLVFADVSGFTALSERLAKQGRVGAEILADTISSCFSRLLAAAYSNGGSLLKFGGDALLLWFTGPDHCRRACSAAAGMRRQLRAIGPIDGASGRTRLRMSVGVHTGDCHLFLVGRTSRELIVAGPAATTVVGMEAAADKGEIVMSAAVATQLPPSSVGAAKGDGFLLRREPGGLLHSGESTMHAYDADVLRRGMPSWLCQLAEASTDDPQHRNVTVAFVKFRGLDSLIADRGADVAAAELDRLVSDTQASVDRHDVFLLGTDVDKDGGKLLVAGGAPRATGGEEEAVLCVAREVVDADRLLSVQVGVNAGSAFAGDIGPAYRRTFTVMGDTVNLAARVMAHAEPGSVLATQPVLERSRVLFDTTPVEPFTVKGKTAPVHASVVGPPRQRIQVDPALLPIIGRDAELAILQQTWEQARGGHGGVVILGGEPGIGKSRLIAELRRRVPARQLAVACDQYAANTAYWAARQLLRQALGCAAGDDGAVRTALVEAFTGPAADLAPWAPLVGMVAGVELPMTTTVAELDDRFRRARLEQAVAGLLTTLLTEPTLLVIEDAHWVDEASAHLLGSAVPQVDRAPWLVVASRRVQARGFHPPPGGNVRVVELEPLPAGAATALAEVLAVDAAGLDPGVVETVVERSGGNPLFLAELMAGVRREGTATLPESLEGLILARIDALAPDDRSLLRRLSVLGASVPHELARAVLGGELVPSPRDAVWRRLAEFVDAGGGTLEFRHALLMDGAYNSLPFRVRESLHAVVGDTIERGAGGASGDHAEVLSQHFFKAKRYAQAWRYSRLAAERSLAVFANADAASFYERAIESARKLGGAETDELLLLLERLGDTRRRMGEPAEAEAAFRQARRMAPADPVVQSRLLLKQAGVRQQEGSFSTALRWLHRAGRLLDPVTGGEATRQRARVAVARASVAKDQGRPRAIVDSCQAALRAAAQVDDKAVLAHASLLLDHALVALGRPEQAVHSSDALALYEELGDLWGQGSVLNNLGARAYWDGRWDEAISLYERALAAYQRIGDINYVAYAQLNIGEIRSDQGRHDEAETLFERARLTWERIGDRASVAYALSSLGRLRSRQRRFSDAFDLLSAARAMAQSVGLAADALEADVRLAEAIGRAGQTSRALEAVDRLLPRIAAAPAALRAQLHRVRGLALLARGEVDAAAEALAASRLEAGASRSPFETALTLRALGHLAVAAGRDSLTLLTEAQQLLDTLGVVAVDEPPDLPLSETAVFPMPEQRATARSSVRS